MGEVIILQKDNTISYSQIHNLLKRSHKSNVDKGLIYITYRQSVDELQQKIEIDDSICFVAICDGDAVGTVTISFRNLNYWYHNGRVAIIKLLGVIPEFRGKGISSLLIKKCLEEAEKRHINVIVSDSAEQNKSIERLYLKSGFLISDYGVYEGNNFYTVVYVRWNDGCPYNKFYRKFRYLLKKYYIRTKYKEGKIKRF